MKLLKGCIYRFKYQGYHSDKFPMALILYSDNLKTHALNLNYLRPHMRNEVIDMISKLATSKLRVNHRSKKEEEILFKGSDTYQLYHMYLKRKLPQIIRFAYRTYHTHLILNDQIVSKGFWHMRTFLQNVKKFTGKDTDKTFKDIKAAIKEASNEGKQNTKLRRLNNLNAWKELNSKAIHEKAVGYLNEVNKIYKDKFDPSKYTM
jgi:hypothetical protein